MFDREKLKKLMEKHPMTGQKVTQFAVAANTMLMPASIFNLVHGVSLNPNFDTVERLALYFFGDHRKISEFQDNRPPVLERTIKNGSMTASKKKVKK